MIPHEYIEELTRRTDIVDVVGNYVQLKRKGRLYGGLCPFHSEKTPSFYVYPDTQSFYCFGCGVGGDVIHFVRRINSIDYTEAVKMLAARAGMPEPQEDDKTGRLRSRILSMNKEAARYFHACLNSTVEEARQARPYRRPGPAGAGAVWTTRPSSGSGWAMHRMTGRGCTSICAIRGTTSRSWMPAACSSAASQAGSTACSGSG